jgi:acetyl-CoA carboxylase carboxyltransferase component
MNRPMSRARVPGIVSADVREVDGRPVVWVDVDATEKQGALSSASSSQIEAAAVLARTKGFPLVAIVRSSGADITEGLAALHGWGLAARAIADCSGVVPVIMVVDGPAVSGPALLIGLADLVVMTSGSYAFVSGPTMVAEFTGVVIDNEELGGASSHARYTGAASLVAPDLEVATETTRSTARRPRPGR